MIILMQDYSNIIQRIFYDKHHQTTLEVSLAIVLGPHSGTNHNLLTVDLRAIIPVSVIPNIGLYYELVSSDLSDRIVD